MRAFLEKLEPELRELEPSFRYSVATRHLLKGSLMLSREEVLNRPDYCVFLVHYIERIRRFWMSASLRFMNDEPSTTPPTSCWARFVIVGRNLGVVAR